MRLVLGVVRQILLQVRLGDRFEEVFRALGGVLREVGRGIRAISNLGQFLPTRRNRQYRQSLKLLDQFVHDSIGARRADPDEHDDLPPLFMTAFDDPNSPGASTKQLRDEVVTYLIGDHETTAAGLMTARPMDREATSEGLATHQTECAGCPSAAPAHTDLSSTSGMYFDRAGALFLNPP